MIWFDGKLEEQVNVPLLCNSLHYGTSVFEGIRCYETEKGPAIFRLNEHIDRFFYSMQAVGLDVPYTKKDIIEATKEIVRATELTACYIRPIAYFGAGQMGITNLRNADQHIAIAAWAWNKYLGDNPVKVTVSKYMRLHPRSVDGNAKVGGYYINSVFAGEDAHKRGYDEALLLDYRGNVAEGPGENIFFYSNDTIVTPKEECVLSGITRRTIIECAAELGLKVKEIDIPQADIKNYDGAFFTGTAAEITPILSIDDHKFADTSLSSKIKKYYDDLVKGRLDTSSKYLTYIS